LNDLIDLVSLSLNNNWNASTVPEAPQRQQQGNDYDIAAALVVWTTEDFGAQNSLQVQQRQLKSTTLKSKNSTTSTHCSLPGNTDL
jgi:hypothetical protein